MRTTIRELVDLSEKADRADEFLMGRRAKLGPEAPIEKEMRRVSEGVGDVARFLDGLLDKEIDLLVASALESPEDVPRR